MKKITFILACAGLTLASCGDSKKQENNAQQSSAMEQTTAETGQSASVTIKKYPVKSGIVTFENIMKMGSMEVKEKKILYFTDYGMKEREDTYEGETLKESFMSDGKDLYTLIHSDKSAYKAGAATRGVAYKFDYNEFSEDDKKNKVKKGANETIAGKDCEVYTFGDTKFAGWNNICLLTEMETKQMKNTLKAVTVEEIEVPGDKFAVPSDYQLKSM